MTQMTLLQARGDFVSLRGDSLTMSRTARAARSRTIPSTLSRRPITGR